MESINKNTPIAEQQKDVEMEDEDKENKEKPESPFFATIFPL